MPREVGTPPTQSSLRPQPCTLQPPSHLAWHQAADRQGPHHGAAPLSSAGSSIGVTEINAWKLELQHRLGEETFPSGLLGFHLSLAHLRGSLPAQEIKRPGAGGGGGVSADRSQAPRPNRTRPEVSEVPSWLCAHRRVCACTPPLGHPGAGGQAAHRGRGTRDPSRDSGLRCIWQQAQRPLLGMSKALPGDS